MPVRPLGILWDTSVYLGIHVKSTFLIHKSTIREAIQVRPVLVAAEYSSRRGLELEYSRPPASVCVNIHALERRGTITAGQPGGVRRVAHRGDSPSVAAPRKSAPAGSETDRDATQEGFRPARSVARRSVERAPVAVSSARPGRPGAYHDRHDPEHEHDEQVGGHRSLLVWPHHTRRETPTQESER